MIIAPVMVGSPYPATEVLRPIWNMDNSTNDRFFRSPCDKFHNVYLHECCIFEQSTAFNFYCMHFLMS